MSAIEQVEEIMLKGDWMTIPDVQRRLEDWYMETTVSARIRDLRKPKHGGHDIDRRRKKGSKLWEYRMVE